MPAFRPVHATKRDIARRHSANRVGVLEIARPRLDHRSKTSAANRVGSDIYLQPPHARVLSSGERQPVQVDLLDTVGVNENERADPKANELLDERLPESRNADDSDAKASQQRGGRPPEGLFVSPNESYGFTAVSTPVKEAQLIANDRNEVNRRESSGIVNQTCDARPIRKNNHAGMREAIVRPAVHRAEELPVGCVVRRREIGKTAGVTVDFDDGRVLAHGALNERADRRC
jgi:hypothetical protein